MNLFLRAGLGATLHLLLASPASAAWEGAAGLGARGVSHTEYDNAGRRLVRESGWLPGIVLNGAYTSGNFTWFAAADWYRRNIAYHGQTQGGTPVDSTTATGLASLRVGGAYAIARDYSVSVAVEADRWQRDIHGTGTSVGLQERYRSERLIVGAGKAWHPAHGTLATEAAVLFSTPERMRVGFSGLLDPTSLDTKRSHALRFGLAFRPARTPTLELRTTLEWTRIARSDDVPVRRQGQFMGTVAQPEHERKALTLAVARLF